MTREKHAVTERNASRAMQPDDLLFGQLASAMIEACNSVVVPPMEKGPIIELRARIAFSLPAITRQVLRDCDFELLELFHEIAEWFFNPQLPILRCTDGEPLSLEKLVFDLSVSPQTAFDALKHLALDEPYEVLLADVLRNAEDKPTGVCFS